MPQTHPFKRLPVTRTSTTQKRYLKEGGKLLRRSMEAAPNAPDEVGALIELFSDESWVLRPATTRSYLAQLKAVINELVSLGKIGPERAEAALAELARLIEARRGKPPARTSAKKMKNGSYLDYCKILNDFACRARRQPNGLDAADQVLALLLRVGPYVGLRPVEWLNATVSADNLTVQNAKNSNGRTPGQPRTIQLSSLPQPVAAILGDLIGGIRQLFKAKAEWTRVLKMLGERLARVCDRLKLQRWCLAALRHIAEATWKRAGLSLAEIAALSGHRSTATSGRYYAGARHGWQARFACARPEASLVVVIAKINAASASALAPSREAAVLEHATDGPPPSSFGFR